jgi:hypothetical protein
MVGQGPRTILKSIYTVSQLISALCVGESRVSSHRCHRHHNEGRRQEQHYLWYYTHYITSFVRIPVGLFLAGCAVASTELTQAAISSTKKPSGSIGRLTLATLEGYGARTVPKACSIFWANTLPEPGCSVTHLDRNLHHLDHLLSMYLFDLRVRRAPQDLAVG